MASRSWSGGLVASLPAAVYCPRRFSSAGTTRKRKRRMMGRNELISMAKEVLSIIT
jgi:hypothetical protein